MTTRIFRGATLLGFLLLAATSARAQSGDHISFRVPFDFRASQTELPAGLYTARKVSAKVLLIHNEEGKGSALVLVPQFVVRKSGRAAERVVFRQVGDSYFLGQVWMDRRGDGLGTRLSKAERQLLEELKMENGRGRVKLVEVAATAR